jgi:hypothetical protein
MAAVNVLRKVLLDHTWIQDPRWRRDRLKCMKSFADEQIIHFFLKTVSENI